MVTRSNVRGGAAAGHASRTRRISRRSDPRILALATPRTGRTIFRQLRGQRTQPLANTSAALFALASLSPAAHRVWACSARILRSTGLKSPATSTAADRPGAPPRGSRRSGRGAARALWTEPDEREVGEAHLVTKPPPDVVAHRIEQLGADGSSGAAARAADVLLLAVPDERVQAGPVSKVDVAQQAVALERLEVPIDGGRDEPGLIPNTSCSTSAGSSAR
jgi:hypothetical protein